MKNGDKYAFATDNPDEKGMTKREYAAVHILSALMASDRRWSSDQRPVEWAVEQADALLEELERQ